MTEPKFTCAVIRSILSNPNGKTYGRENRYLIWRMLQGMNERQTFEEQAIQGTKETNGIGFNKFDAPVLTDIAHKSYQYKNLTPAQARLVGRRLMKYIKQLCSIAGVPYDKKPVKREPQQQTELPYPQQRSGDCPF